MRSLSHALDWPTAATPALAGVPAAAVAPTAVLLRGERSTRSALRLRLRLPLDRPPPLALDIAFTLAVLLGAATFGAVRGGELDAFVATNGSLSDVAARALGLRGRRRHRIRRDAHERIAHPVDRRDQRQELAAVLRRRRGQGAARSRSARQAGERAEALPESDRRRDRRAHALRRVAEGRPGSRHRRRRRPDRRRAATAGTSTCRSSSARAPIRACANSPPCSTRWRSSGRASPPESWSASVAGTSS